MKKFLIKLLLFSILVFFLDYGWQRLSPVSKQVPLVWWMVGFFVLLTGCLHYFSIEASKSKPQNFIRFYMASTGLKIMGCLLIILVYRYYDKPTFVPFSLGFIIHYFAFTIFETPILLNELKNNERSI
jgi:F0F1-type ATP synthase assembly protein I